MKSTSRTVSLPLYPSRPIPQSATTAIDRTRPYASCSWLEGGLAFNRRSLNACLIVHHNRGFPELCKYNGGPVDTDAVLAARAAIISENQRDGYEACRGCPHLVVKKWPEPRYPFRLLGIAQFAHCNIECSYCYLQWQDPATFVDGFDPYPLMPALRSLIDSGLLDPGSTADWGGGEPTIYREFDEVLELLTRRGATTFIHTNGTRLPQPIKDGLSTKRIHIICSVDAGTPATWKLIKNKDLLETVWRNLDQYVRLGVRVILKYIVKEENCDETELDLFVRRAVRTGARELVLDIDYTKPHPSPPVVAGLRYLKRIATSAGMHVTFGSTGSLFTPEIDVASRLEGATEDRWRPRVAHLKVQASLVRRMLRVR